MGICIVTGSAGLIGSEACRYMAARGMKVIGIDNNMRAYFFGQDASTSLNLLSVMEQVPDYTHVNSDIRDEKSMRRVFYEYGSDIDLIIHTAAQPSHDWAAKEPMTDFSINASATLMLLELMRLYCPKAVFIYTSTNKVYGDKPNQLPLVELDTRWEVNDAKYVNGIDESFGIDMCTHSLFGVSKVSADLMVQEYGRYFGIKSVCFRGGCLTGPCHAGAPLHGFLSYLALCVVRGSNYVINGYKGKQVRDNIHCNDLVNAFWHFYKNPRVGEVYNIGGSRYSNCSVLEAISLCEKIVGKKLNVSYSDSNRVGDHVWWISDVGKFKAHYPAWDYNHGLESILVEIIEEHGGALV